VQRQVYPTAKFDTFLFKIDVSVRYFVTDTLVVSPSIISHWLPSPTLSGPYPQIGPLHCNHLLAVPNSKHLLPLGFGKDENQYFPLRSESVSLQGFWGLKYYLNVRYQTYWVLIRLQWFGLIWTTIGKSPFANLQI